MSKATANTERFDLAIIGGGITFDPSQPMGRRTREIHDLAPRGMPNVLAMTAGPVQSHMSAGRELHAAVEHLFGPARRQAKALDDVALGTSAATSERPKDNQLFRIAVRDEHARDLPGILYTRTGRAWGRQLAPCVAGVARPVADLLGWDASRQAEEVKAFLEYQNRNHPRGEAA